MYKSYDQLGVQPEPDRDVLEVLEIANVQHKKHILSNHNVVCVDIYADWCGPCKQTAPEYSLVAAKYSKPGVCAVVKYNLDKMDPSEKNRIHGIPVFQFFVNGQQIDEIVGADIPRVEEKLKTILQGGVPRPQQQQVEDLTKGPVYNRNSIRHNRSQMPQMDSSSGEPYMANTGNYHQPYQGQPSRPGTLEHSYRGPQGQYQ
jgi:thioredoxin 1